MKKISITTRRWIIVFHLAFGGLWLGAATSLVLLSYMFSLPKSSEALITIHNALKWIDDAIIIPCAFLSLISGFLICYYTKWGFFVHKWVIWKWAVTIFLILFGAAFLGPWIDGMAHIARKDGIAALQNDTFAYYSLSNRIFVFVQIFSLIFLIAISIFKPWGKRKAYEKKK